jgi:uncharacterized protein YjhX (UPF0386 family)
MLNNRGDNIMITTSVMNLSVSENTFEKNAAIIIKSKETKDGKLFEYVTVPRVADRTEKAVLKAAIKFVFDYMAIYKTDSDGLKVNVEKDKDGKVTRVTCLDENGKVVECKDLNGNPLQIHAAKITRLLASFGKDSGYKIGYTNDKGRFTPVFTPKKSLNNFLCISAKNIEDYILANSDTKKAIRNNSLKAAIAGTTQEERFWKSYNEGENKASKKAAKVEEEKVEA